MITIYISAYQVPDTIKSSLNKVLDFHSNLEIIVTAFFMEWFTELSKIS